MNEIRDLFPGRMRERTFQLKAQLPWSSTKLSR